MTTTHSDKEHNMIETVTIHNARNARVLVDIPADEAEYMVKEWNEGLGSNDWYIAR